MSSRSDKSKTHIPELDGVRACSILLVIAAHALPLGPKFLQLNASAGLMGMSLFFCLSGFLITSILYRNQNILEFFVKRLSRIIPAASLYITIMIFFGISFDGYVYNIIFISNYIDGDIVGVPISHFWSLCVEIQFYIFIGFLVLLLGRRGLWILIPLCVAITMLRIHNDAIYSIRTHLRVDEILVGCCLALFNTSDDQTSKARSYLFSRTTPLVLLITFLLFLSSSYFGQALGYLRPYFAGLFVWAAIYGNWPLLSRFLSHWIMVYIAHISYALYIYHPLMIHGFMNEGSIFERYVLKRPISFALAWAAAHMSTFWWERIWSQLAQRKLLPAKIPG